MSKQDFVQPSRPLSTNFTDNTLRRAISEKRQATGLPAEEGTITMKKNILLQPTGVFVALAIVVLGSVGVYAAANWFGGNVEVTSDDSVMTVDLSKCESNMPPGVATTDRKNVKFKITGSPHIQVQDLQQKLLANCEFDSVLHIYQAKYGENVGMSSSVIKSFNPQDNSITLDFTFGGEAIEKTFSLKKDGIVYDKGQQVSTSRLKVGDYAIFAYRRDTNNNLQETDNPFNNLTSIDSIFKTQYDTRESLEGVKSFYDSNNIMPLDQYNQLQHKKVR